MKSFNFSMQKVLEYNEHIQNHEKNVLQEMKFKFDGLCFELEVLLKKYELYNNEFCFMCKIGVVINEVINLRNYIIEVRSQISILNNKIIAADVEINEQIQKVLNITKEKTSIEKLKDKYFETYKSLERKVEEVFINEFILNAAFSQPQNLLVESR